MPPANDTNPTPKRCFVIMGFGIKTDFATGRKLDLNKSYKLLIKPVVENKGIVCIRADEILHSGSIDYQMYKELYNADLVIADLSTANVNAFYELGIRHALRSRTTIVISEDKLSYPFDLNHIKITSYTHLGEAIDYEEVERFRKVLGETIETVLNINDPDSPVYSYLPDLNPPLFKSIENLQNNFVKDILHNPDPDDDGLVTDKNTSDNPTLGSLIELGETALYERKFAEAKTFFKGAITILKSESKDESSNDSYLIHRLAFATYKAKLPDAITSLKEAIQLLSKLDIERTNDTETVSLAGRIEKKLYENGQGDQHLANAIQFYQRGYFLLHNRYHGINLAFLFNKRVDTSIFNTREDKIADMIFANRVRRQVLEMCEEDWNVIINRKNRYILKTSSVDSVNFSDYNAADDNEQLFWIQVNKAECHYCMGEIDEYKLAVARAKKIEHADWMMKAFEKQLSELQTLFHKYGNLLNPPWSEF